MSLTYQLILILYFLSKKAEAATKAREAVVKHLLSLGTQEALTYKKEAAGSIAYIIKHYIQVSHRLKQDSRVLIIAGGHGTNLELLLQEALIRRDESGSEIRGFSNLLNSCIF